MNKTSDWQTVATFSTVQEAYIARGMLDAHGIPAMIPDEVMSGSVYPMTLTWAGVDLLVPAADAPRARALLAESGTNN